MSFENPFADFAFGDFLETLLPDFVLAFAFFTALTYAILGKRLDHRRPAIAASAALGFALSVGLVWWEQAHDFSIRNLGPIAVGFAVLILAFVMYQAIHQVGGSWAGAGLALGGSIIVASILQTDWPVDPQIIQSVTTVALVVGILAFLMHHQPHMAALVPPSREVANVRHNMADLFRDRHLSRRLRDQFRHLRKESSHLNEHPEEAEDIMLQLQRMLPAEGYLTERLAALRAQAYRLREGHVARIEEIQKHIKDLSPEEKRRISQQLMLQYRELGLDNRMDRLDHTVAELETRIKNLTRQAQQYLARHDYRKLHAALKEAGNLQKHNTRLFQTINRTEKKLMAIAATVAKDTHQVSDG